MEFTPEQRTAIERSCNLVVTAGAGSGKTRVLVERYLRLILEHGVGAVLAITFTDKAAREMRARVRQTIETRARAANDDDRADWEERRAAAEAARIGTIHAFCGALLRAQPAESELDPRFVVLDEVQAGMLLAESIDAAIAQAARAASDDVELAAALAEFGLAELRGMLDGMLRGGSQVRAALAAMPAADDALCAFWRERLAATRATALAELFADPAWCAATDALRRLGPHTPPGDRIGAQVRAIVAWLTSVDADTATADDFAAIEAIDLRSGSAKHWGGKEALEEAKSALRTLREAYKAIKEWLAAPDDDLERRAARVTLGLRTLYDLASARYRRDKDERDALDFDDLERRARDLLVSNPAVRARWQAELRAVLVDEFQDTNADQRDIIYALTGLLDGEAGDGRSPELFVVGDGKQSIYRFRGADVSVFRQAADDIERQGGQSTSMQMSFRTHQTLVAWVNQVTEAIFARPGALRSYEFPFEPLNAYRDTAPLKRCVELHITGGGDSADERRAAEAQAIARRIKELCESDEPIVFDGADRNHRWRAPKPDDFAFLFQTSTVFEIYEQALREADIPFLTTAGRGYYGRKEVQDLIHLLRTLDDPADDLALVGVLRAPLFAIDDASIISLRLANPNGAIWDALQAGNNAAAADERSAALDFARVTLRDLHARRARVTVVELLRAALASTGYLATISGLPDGARRRVNVEKLLEAVRLAGSNGLSALSEYLEDLLRAEPREGEAPLEADGSVRLMTIHRSKGLEFPIVVLPDLTRTPNSRTDAWLARRDLGLALKLRDAANEWQPSIAYRLAMDEERRMEQAERERLLYVALTRARDYLILGGATGRMRGDNWFKRIAAALGWSGDADAPTAGSYGALEVFVY